MNRICLLMASNGDPIRHVKDFKYIGSRMEGTERDTGEKKASALGPSTT